MSNSGERIGASKIARARGFAVHIFTALGSGVALLALLAAVHGQWDVMFGWLGIALLIDAIDGPLARRFQIVDLLPNWSGETLDLVVDFTTYVFVPAFAIVASGLLMPAIASLLGIAITVSGALYFADRRMKTEDNHFRGFPTLWNIAAFYLFLLRPSPEAASLLMAALVVATFLPIRIVHPMRVVRLRAFNIALSILWGLLASVAILQNFNSAGFVSVLLCLIALYFIIGEPVLQAMQRVRT